MKKYIIIAIALVVCSLIIGGSLLFVQISKQNSIERQKLWELDQDKKEYIAKRKMECYEIYQKEREQFTNVENFGYVETCAVYDDVQVNIFCQDDSCEIIYKDTETGEYFRKYY